MPCEEGEHRRLGEPNRGEQRWLYNGKKLRGSSCTERHAVNADELSYLGI